MTIPQHIAIIMDGNGRWAKAQGKRRNEGHLAGVQKVRDIAIHAKARGVKYLTLYAFSTENWRRPEEEVGYIMSLPKFFFNSYLKELMANDIKVNLLGDMAGIPKVARDIFKAAIEETKDNRSMVLNFAVNYGSRDEIVKAAMAYGQDYKEGLVGEVDEKSFSMYLSTGDMPDVDLLIRTSGEKRLSNFLLWQLAYSEMIFTPTFWPDFSEADFDECLKEYALRNRRFGGLDEDESD